MTDISATQPVHGAASPWRQADTTVQQGRGFSQMLSHAMQGRDREEAREVLREAAEQLVATAFITPILGALRENSLAEGPFAPNAAEKRFGPLLDQQFADRITQSAKFSLVDTIVDRYLPPE
jgi:Rod binding domain-containing protein